MKPNVSSGVSSVQFSILGQIYFVRTERRWGSRKPSHTDCNILNYCSMHITSKLERDISINQEGSWDLTSFPSQCSSPVNSGQQKLFKMRETAVQVWMLHSRLLPC